jgi:hypothetical protein
MTSKIVRGLVFTFVSIEFIISPTMAVYANVPQTFYDPNGSSKFLGLYAQLFPNLAAQVSDVSVPPEQAAENTPEIPAYQVPPQTPLPPMSTKVDSSNVQPTPAPPPPVSGGFKTTHYGYADDPALDSYSKKGIGAFGDNKLVPLQSVALTAKMAKKLKVSPGDKIQAIDTSGNKHILSYDDKAPEDDARIDVYNPQGSQSTGEPFQIAQAMKFTGDNS